jgi:hypothetical protein
MNFFEIINLVESESVSQLIRMVLNEKMESIRHQKHDQIDRRTLISLKISWRNVCKSKVTADITCFF